MQYPKRIVRRHERDAAVVQAVISQLNLSRPTDSQLDPDDFHNGFDRRLERAVEYFQTLHADVNGNPLVVDGEIGPITWTALFGKNNVPGAVAPNNDRTVLREAIIKVAEMELEKKVREVAPPPPNHGPDVKKYLGSVERPQGDAWCVAFLYWCCLTGAANVGVPVPMIQTAGVLRHWKKARTHTPAIHTIDIESALDDPTLVRRGAMFIIDKGEGLGHSGIVIEAQGGFMTTIEGNTDGSGMREGDGVYLRKRKIAEINVGFIDYFN